MAVKKPADQPAIVPEPLPVDPFLLPIFVEYRQPYLTGDLDDSLEASAVEVLPGGALDVTTTSGTRILLAPHLWKRVTYPDGWEPGRRYS